MPQVDINYIPSAPMVRRQRRLHCAMVLHPWPKLEDIEAARSTTAERFIHDMERTGWHWLGRPFHLEGPVPEIHVVTPKKREQVGGPSEYIQDRPLGPVGLLEAEGWMYFISAEFWREMPLRTEILVTSPGEVPVNYSKGVLS